MKGKITRHTSKSYEISSWQYVHVMYGFVFDMICNPKSCAYQVQFSHSFNHRLIGLFVSGKVEGRILLSQFDETITHLFQICLTLGLNGNFDDWIWELHTEKAGLILLCFLCILLNEISDQSSMIQTSAKRSPSFFYYESTSITCKIFSESMRLINIWFSPKVIGTAFESNAHNI